MFLRAVTVTILSVALWLTPTADAEPLWSSTNLQYMKARDYLNPFSEKHFRGTTITLEHAAGYEWGKTFLFFDHLSDDESNINDEIYSEVSVGLSLNHFTDINFKRGPLNDVFLTGAWEHSDAGQNTRNYLLGLNASWDIPGFAFFDTGIYARNNGLKGRNYQLTTAWSLPFKVHNAQLYFDGFFDIETTPKNGPSRSLIKFQPQLKLDIGHFFQQPGKYLVGIEMDIWKNKFGVRDQDQYTTQLLLQIFF